MGLRMVSFRVYPKGPRAQIIRIPLKGFDRGIYRNYIRVQGPK